MQTITTRINDMRIHIAADKHSTRAVVRVALNGHTTYTVIERDGNYLVRTLQECLYCPSWFRIC